MTDTERKKSPLEASMFAEVLHTLFDKGFTLPLYWTAISSDGCILGGRFTESDTGGLEIEVLVEYYSGAEGLRTPLNMMFMDLKSGKACRVPIKGPGGIDYLH